MQTEVAAARAAVFREVGQPLTLDAFPIPSLRGREALVRIRCSTICGSDLHSYFGRRHSPTPSVLGHEMVGEIVAMGPEGTRAWNGEPLSLGDRVTWSMVWSCGECFYCTHHLRQKCERLMKFGHEQLQAGRELTGGMAEYCWLPERTAIFCVPGNVPDVVASPANCATATLASVFRAADPVAGCVVTVHGAGMLGQTACAMAAMHGASQVIVIEPDARRREMALRFGATAALDSALPAAELKMRVEELSQGRGADVGLELAGWPDSAETGIGLLRLGGQFVMAGATFPSRDLQLSGEQIVRRMIRVAGVYNYAPEDLETALTFLAGAVGRFPFEDLVERSFPLSEVNVAMQYAERTKPPRVALLP